MSERPDAADRWQPLSRRDSIRFWLVVDVIAFISYALIVWAFKP